MQEEGLDLTVVAGHHAIALKERLAMVEGGLSLLRIIGNHHVEVQQRHVLFGSSLHDADAPIDIGRVAILQVVGRGNGKVGTGIKSLMATSLMVSRSWSQAPTTLCR